MPCFQLRFVACDRTCTVWIHLVYLRRWASRCIKYALNRPHFSLQRWIGIAIAVHRDSPTAQTRVRLQTSTLARFQRFDDYGTAGFAEYESVMIAIERTARELGLVSIAI